MAPEPAAASGAAAEDKVGLTLIKYGMPLVRHAPSPGLAFVDVFVPATAWHPTAADTLDNFQD